MGLFGRREPIPVTPTSPATAPAVANSIVLPPPRPASTREEADALLEEVGRIQRRVMDGAPLAGTGEALVSNIEGAALYFLSAGAEPAAVFDQIIAPISEWGMGRLLGPSLMNPTSNEGVASKHAFDVVCALREKYQHLNPNNT